MSRRDRDVRRRDARSESRLAWTTRTKPDAQSLPAGLIWFSHEALGRLRYQVLEAQPDVIEAMRRAGHARTVRRSILLTAFGSDFCAVVLPLDPAGQASEGATGA